MKTRSFKTDEKGVIALTSAITIPMILFVIFLIIEVAFYFFGMFETNFISLDLSRYLRDGGSVGAYFSEPRAIFQDMCIKADGSSGYEITLSEMNVSGHDYQVLEVACKWDFAFLGKVFGTEQITPGYRFQAIYDADYVAEIAARSME